MPTGISYVDETWNPIRGCEPVSPGCDNCYAKGVAERWWSHLVYKGAWRGAISLVTEALEKPLRWGIIKTCLCCDWESGRSWCPVHVFKGARTTRGRRILVPSMGDLFHDKVPLRYIAAVFGAMSMTPAHTFLVLTKRIDRAADFLTRAQRSRQPMTPTDECLLMVSDYIPEARQGPPARWPLPNVLIGCTVENQRLARERWPLLAEVAAMGWRTWLSLEPLLGPIHGLPVALWGHPATDDRVCDPAMLTTPEFVAVGAETGPGARPCATRWIRPIVERCADANVRCHVKQLAKGKPWNPDEWPRELVETRAAR